MGKILYYKTSGIKEFQIHLNRKNQGPSENDGAHVLHYPNKKDRGEGRSVGATLRRGDVRKLPWIKKAHSCFKLMFLWRDGK